MNIYEKIMNTYTEQEQVEIEKRITILAILGYGNAPETEEEFKAFCEETLEQNKKYEKEEREKKERKIQKEKENAEKAGMTVEEFKEFKKLEAKKRRYAREIEKMKEEIENLKKEIEKKENFLKNN